MLIACGGGGGNNDPTNAAPVAVADYAKGDEGEFCFDGTESSDADGSVVSWQWQRQPDSATPAQETESDDGAKLCITVQRMEPNDPDTHLYAYELTVIDNGGASDSTTAEAWVPETDPRFLPPIPVDAGADQSVVSGADATLSGKTSAGEFPCEATSCTWVQMTGPEVGLTVVGSCSIGIGFDATFTAPQVSQGETFLGFRMTASDDGEGASCETRDYVAVSVRSGP